MSTAVGVWSAGVLSLSPWLPPRHSQTMAKSTGQSFALQGGPRSLLGGPRFSKSCHSLCTSLGLELLRNSSPCLSNHDVRLNCSLPSEFSLHQKRTGHCGRSVRAATSGRVPAPGIDSEEVFFDGGVHYGDLVTNLLFGLTLVWLPLTLAAVFRNLYLRYRFTNLRVTIQSGLLGDDRKDFSYDVIKDVKVVPRFIGEWGDMVIELKDGTKVDLRCVPKFREIAKYIEARISAVGDKRKGKLDPTTVSATTTSKKGFS